ncbi:GspE/PulE family protein [Sphaerotilus sp.]|uniref:GspE/PulE family protein n=1 Tax=Sphaerotilus sp. TaxID=2093942 RepID=UPI0034E2660A
MSDLSQSHLKSAAPAEAPLPLSARPRKGGDTPFAWPTPPFAAYALPEPQCGPLACEIEGRTGNLMTGELVAMEVVAGIARVQVPPERISLPMRFDQIRRITLRATTVPLARQTVAAPEAAPAGTPAEPASEEHARVLEHHAAQPYTVHLSGGGSVGGVTVGHVENEVGLFLFAPLDDRGTVQTSFMPRSAYDRVLVGERLGQLLVEEAAITPEQVEQAVQIQKKNRGQKLGELLVARQIVTPEQLLSALDKQARMPMVRLGEALVALGYVTDEQLGDVLGQQVTERMQPLGEVLLSREWVTQQQLRVALARKLGYPVVNLSTFKPQIEALARLPVDLARTLEVLPLVHRAGRLVVAMQDVTRQAVLEQLQTLTHCTIAPALAGTGDLKAAIERGYERLPMPDLDGGPASPEAASDAGDLAESATGRRAGKSAKGDKAERSGGPVVQLLITLVADAMGRGASSIHLENHPSEDKLWVRLRRDGRMEPHSELPGSYRNSLIPRIKTLAEMDVQDTRRPQEGRLAFSRLMQAHKIELRVTTLPTHGGFEDVVLGLPTRLKTLKFDGLGLTTQDQERIAGLLKRPSGMVLTVGPARSGRTTTLFAELALVNQPDRKIVSIEERIEMSLPGVRQIEVNPRTGHTHEQALQAVMSADADIILIDAIRDSATARLATEAAVSGRLVLASMVGRTASEAVQRLLDMGVEPWNLGDALLGVHAQRLLRRLCSACRMSRSAKEPEIDEWIEGYFHGAAVEAAEAERAQLRASWLERYGRDGRLRRYQSAGCERCRESGYRGRVAVHELLVINRELRRLIRAGAPAWNIQRQGLVDGMRTLRQDAVEKMLAGLTSLDEVRSVADL